MVQELVSTFNFFLGLAVCLITMQAVAIFFCTLFSISR